jgi:hypothetical protein
MSRGLVVLMLVCAGCVRLGYDNDRPPVTQDDAAHEASSGSYTASVSSDGKAPQLDGGLKSDVASFDLKPNPDLQLDSTKPLSDSGDPCAGIVCPDVCCIRAGQTKPSCGSNYFQCKCGGTTGFTCGGNEPICCDRGSGYLCYPSHYQCR